MALLDSEIQTPEQNTLWTIRLLIAASVQSLILILFFSADGALGIPHRIVSSILPLLFLGIFLCSLIGFVFGFLERKKNRARALLGIVGNGLVLLFLVGIVAISLYVVSHVSMIG